MNSGEGYLPLRPTRYERVSIGLTSVLLMLGGATLLLLIVWLSRSAARNVFPAQVAIIPGPDGVDSAADRAGAGDFESPRAEELKETAEPSPAPVLETIAPIVEAQVATLDSLLLAGSPDGSGRDSESRSSGTKTAPLIGTLAPWERWEVRFSASDLAEYKRQLDHFGIELGVAGGGIRTVDYVKHFTAEIPTIRRGQDASLEKRLRFHYRDGTLKEADRELARAAGIDVTGRIVFQFHTDVLYNTLLRLENEQMKQRGIRIGDVVRTVFAVRPAGDGYEFYVVRLDYRLRGFAPVRPRAT